MKVLVTGVGGQLGHDVMNELAKRGYEGVGSDIAPTLIRCASWQQRRYRRISPVMRKSKRMPIEGRCLGYW